MPNRRVLVVAPDRDLQSSLVFLLEASGYVVTSLPDIGSFPTTQSFGCTVIDHGAIAGPDSILELQPHSGPIVLLAGASMPCIEDLVFRIVRKPLLGEPLIAAVEAAIQPV